MLRIKLNNITKYFSNKQGKVSVFKDVSASFVKGSSYAIIGSSGAGKSTLLHIIGCLQMHTSGSMYVEDNNGAQLDTIKNKLGIMLQHPYLIKELTVKENVMLRGIFLGQFQEHAFQEAITWLEAVGLKSYIDRYPSQLSGGQRQRVSLARALMGNPVFLLVDEPTANLDEDTAQLIIDLLCDIQKKIQCGLIIASHDQRVSGRMDNILCLQQGSLQKVFNNKV